MAAWAFFAVPLGGALTSDWLSFALQIASQPVGTKGLFPAQWEEPGKCKGFPQCILLRGGREGMEGRPGQFYSPRKPLSWWGAPPGTLHFSCCSLRVPEGCPVLKMRL